jgi:hypothetical protein
VIFTEECPSKLETRSIGTPSNGSSTASVSRNQCGRPPFTPAISQSRRKARRQFPASVSFEPIPVQDQCRSLARGQPSSASATNGGRGDVHRDAGLPGVEEHAAAGQPVYCATGSVADAQSGISQEQDKGPQAAGVLLSPYPGRRIVWFLMYF